VLDVRVCGREQKGRVIARVLSVCLEKIRSTDSSKSAHSLNTEGVDLFVDIDLYGKRGCWHESLVVLEQKKSILGENNGLRVDRNRVLGNLLSMAKKKK
jgi:hypothetical protein